MKTNKKVILLTTPSCSKCRIVSKRLTEKNIDFEEINLNENLEELEKVRVLKLLSLPILKINEEYFNDTAKINKFIEGE